MQPDELTFYTYAFEDRDCTLGEGFFVNDVAYEQYIASRESKSKKNQQIQSIEDEVSNMKSDINDIKSLLKELINGSR